MVGGGLSDLAAMVAVLEKAGGRFGSAAGDRSLHTGTAVFTNGVLHDEITHVLTGPGAG